MQATTPSSGNTRSLDQPGSVMEKEKWDRYYAALPVTEAEKPVQEFNAELLACISEILPAGSRILEAGCGGGWHSLELARAGRYKVSLMDFSQNALTYSRRLFEREELCAEFIHGDVILPGEPEFDLVFNSGVLEHYNLEQQAALLRGMASRSRNFVLVFVPNRSCYWYWLSRIEKSGAGQWPFGREVPLVDLSAAFEAAGLRYLGRTFTGEAWTEIFVNGLSGLDEKLRQLILRIHRSPLIMKEQKCYLLAALGSVRQQELSLPARWASHHSTENSHVAELTSALADALALAVGEQNRLRESQHQIGNREQRLEALSAQAQKAVGEKERLAQEWAEDADRQKRILEALTQELAQFKSRGEAKDRLAQDLAVEIERKEREIELLTQESEQFQAAAEENAQRVQDLTVDLQEKKRAMEALTQESERYKAAAEENAQSVQDLTADLEKKDRAMELLARESAQHKAAAAENAQSARELTADLEKKDRAMEAATEELNQSKTAVESLSAELAARRQKIAALTNQVEEREQAVQWRSAQVEERERIIRARDEAIAWLEGELAEARRQFARFPSPKAPLRSPLPALFRNRLQKAAFPFRHPIQWLELRRSYWRFRSAIKRLLIRILPVWSKHMIKSLRYGKNSYPSPPLSIPAASELEKQQHNTPRTPEWSEKADCYSTLTLLPAVPAEQRTTILTHEITPMELRRPDVICFSIIDWDFRYQRPQQMMSQFAVHGHRVFYISTTRFMPHTAKPRAAVKIICDNVYEVSLAVHRPPDVYGEVMEGENKTALLSSLEELRRDHHINDAIGYVMIASWGDVALQAQQKWGWRIVYDCMDNWENFPGVKRPILGMESTLVQNCDLLAVTAKRLYEKWLPYQRPMILVRNGVDFDFYARNTEPNDLLSGLKHPIIGYFGAIADWFDVELLASVARQRPDYNFVLLGGIFDVDVSALRVLSNVHIQGQQPYGSMPLYLYHFDVCIIPFKVNPITEATDPVKLYEYLSAGKPVVAVALPELEPYRELLYIAKDQNDFLVKLDVAVAENDPNMASRRISLAREHTWNERYGRLEEGLTRIVPRSSIIVVTYNNLAFTRLCLESIVRNTEYPNYEVIVVDNKSTDGTQEYLQRTSELYPNVSIILNEHNHGFARANNQGIARSTGEFLILLNNDTVVPPGWLSRLLRHLRSPEIGMAGPVTNFAGNEARIEVSYRTWAQMEAFAHERASSFEGLAADIHMLAMFCVAFRRSTYLAVGPLDEDYGAGLFEDDDYAHRLKAKGYRVICAGDVFVHHFGQASFKNLLQTGEYDALWEKNRRRFETKWNTKWIPHIVAPLRFQSFQEMSHQ